MKFKLFYFATLFCILMSSVFYFSACQKDNHLPQVNSDSTENNVTDRGKPTSCLRKTVHINQLAAIGDGPAFTGNWIQELDRVVNDCVLDRTLCTGGTSAGVESAAFCCTGLFLSQILLDAGLGANLPNVTPAEQDFLIGFTLNFVKNNFAPCAPNSFLTIHKIDYGIDAFTGTLTMAVRWVCCPSGSAG